MVGVDAAHMAMAMGIGYMCNTCDSLADRSNNAYVEPLKLGPSWQLPQPLMVRAATSIRVGDEVFLRYNLAAGSPLHKLLFHNVTHLTASLSLAPSPSPTPASMTTDRDRATHDDQHAPIVIQPTRRNLFIEPHSLSIVFHSDSPLLFPPSTSSSPRIHLRCCRPWDGVSDSGWRGLGGFIVIELFVAVATVAAVAAVVAVFTVLAVVTVPVAVVAAA